MKKAQITFLIFILISFLGIKHTFASKKDSSTNQINFQIEMLHWEEVNKFLPRLAKFTVIDVETGKSFEVQRRAGKHHADVQPLTRKDTKIMKNIYEGHWSWRRRAILILSNNRLIAASMHGMPHGAGALQNGFPGHFCIHFIGSMTHRTERSDLSHQLMIFKAAGKIDEYLVSASPPQLADAIMVFIKNGDKGLVKKVVVSEDMNIKSQVNKIKQIETIQWNRHPVIDADPYSLVTTVPVEVKMHLKEIGPVNTQLSLQLIRTSPISPWKIKFESIGSVIEESLEKQNRLDKPRN
ncbi:hypothetical protein ACQKP0_18525 [Heyndrickxia sp. NPDC080065]|uniref:hypothetical protein n=1 Tax=Heyndrickxia sp. NPDC080065 TaxID=3390568 RepID=UPI003D08DDAD